MLITLLEYNVSFYFHITFAALINFLSAFKVRDAKIRFYFELMVGQDAETTLHGM